MAEMDKPYLKPEEVAERWEVSRGLVCKLLREGQLVGAKIGHVWRIRPCDVYDFEKRTRNAVRKTIGRSATI